MDDVIVVGSGPAGLATAAELRRRGVGVTVLERGDRLGAAWAGRYDGLRFNTSRWLSALPGAPFPKDFGWFPTRDQYVTYLDDYAARHGVTVRTGTTVTRLDPDVDPRGDRVVDPHGDPDVDHDRRRARSADSDVDPAPPGWRLSTTGDTLGARHVVVATGVMHTPNLPAWATGTTYRGSVVHTADYRNPRAYRGRRVLVVGAGSSGLEIARELAEGGAAAVLVAVRTPPNLLPRESGGLPFDLPVPIFLGLPEPLVDAMLRQVQRKFWGDLSEHGLPPATQGAISGLRERGAGTAIVDRATVDAVRDGSIRVVAGVEALDETGARLADGGRVEVDDVVLATGFGTGLEPVAGHLGVLGERGMPLVTDGGEAAPGLRFVGYVFRPGLTGYVGRLARRAAREIAASRGRVPVA